MARLLTDSLLWLVRHWLLVLPLALGFVALWWLLPQPRRRDGRPAAGAGAAALLLGALALLDSTGAAVDHLFYIFAGLAVVSGVCMITQRNPVYAALWFAVVILSTCGLFLLQSAPFLAAATIIVYAGAIIVTFLFVIMLAQQTGLADYDRRSREPLLACLAGFVLLTALLYVLQTTFGAPTGELAQTRLPEIKARLVAVNDLLLRQATKAEIDEAFNLEPQVPIGDALREELKRLPSLRSQVDALQQTIQHLGEARRNEDREEIRRWVGGLLVFADLAADPQKTAGQAWVLPVPADIRTTESSLSRDKSAHVTALGVSLFGDYLWAVELAGTLLLVATIGAIAIAQRARDKVTRRQREEAA